MAKNSNSGIGVLGVLQIVFIVLKLLNLISWNWLVVLIPLWISLAFFVLAMIFLLICEVIDGRKRCKK